jgi:putative FmdB family regulatory protein
MPIFDYECPKCGADENDVFTTRQDFQRPCQKCGGPMKKKMAVFSPIFVGAGWTRKFHACNGKF